MLFSKQHLFFLFALVFALATVSCSDDDDNKDSEPAGSGGNEFGTVTLTLSGDAQGERTGMADFAFLNLAGITQL